MRSFLNKHLDEIIPQQAIGWDHSPTNTWVRSFLRHLNEIIPQQALGWDHSSTSTGMRSFLNNHVDEIIPQQALGLDHSSTSTWMRSFIWPWRTFTFTDSHLAYSFLGNHTSTLQDISRFIGTSCSTIFHSG